MFFFLYEWEWSGGGLDELGTRAEDIVINPDLEKGRTRWTVGENEYAMRTNSITTTPIMTL